MRLLLARVRWANLARLLALPAVVLAVMGWARMTPAPPALPEAAPRPVVAPPPLPSREPRRLVARGGAAKRRAVVKRRGVGAMKPRDVAAAGLRREAAAMRQRPVVSAPAPAAPRPMPATAPPPDPVAAEFGAP